MESRTLERIKKAKGVSSLHSADEFSTQEEFDAIKDDYLKAEKELEDKPVVVKGKKMDRTLSGFKNVYHVVSVILGTATCALVALIFGGVDAGVNSNLPVALQVLIAILAGGMCVYLLYLIEVGKISLASDVFKAIAKKQTKKETTGSLIKLSILVLVSITLSGVGGALISFKSSDKSKIISENYESDKNRISGRYDKEIAHNKQVVRSFELLAINRKKRAWGLTKDEQKNLDNARTQIRKLEAAKAKESEVAKGAYNNQVLKNTDSTSQTMLIAIILITIMELMTMYAYLYHYRYVAMVQREGKRNGIFEARRKEEEMLETRKASQENVPIKTNNEANKAEKLPQIGEKDKMINRLLGEIDLLKASLSMQQAPQAMGTVNASANALKQKDEQIHHLKDELLTLQQQFQVLGKQMQEGIAMQAQLKASTEEAIQKNQQIEEQVELAKSQLAGETPAPRYNQISLRPSGKETKKAATPQDEINAVGQPVEVIAQKETTTFVGIRPKEKESRIDFMSKYPTEQKIIIQTYESHKKEGEPKRVTKSHLAEITNLNRKTLSKLHDAMVAQGRLDTYIK